MQLVLERCFVGDLSLCSVSVICWRPAVTCNMENSDYFIHPHVSVDVPELEYWLRWSKELESDGHVFYSL